MFNYVTMLRLAHVFGLFINQVAWQLDDNETFFRVVV